MADQIRELPGVTKSPSANWVPVVKADYSPNKARHCVRKLKCSHFAGAGVILVAIGFLILVSQPSAECQDAASVDEVFERYNVASFSATNYSFNADPEIPEDETFILVDSESGLEEIKDLTTLQNEINEENDEQNKELMAARVNNPEILESVESNVSDDKEPPEPKPVPAPETVSPKKTPKKSSVPIHEIPNFMKKLIGHWVQLQQINLNRYLELEDGSWMYQVAVKSVTPKLQLKDLSNGKFEQIYYDWLYKRTFVIDFNAEYKVIDPSNTELTCDAKNFVDHTEIVCTGGPGGPVQIIFQLAENDLWMTSTLLAKVEEFGDEAKMIRIFQRRE